MKSPKLPKPRKKNWLKLLAPLIAQARATIKPGGTSVTIPLHTCAEANMRDKWGRIARAKVQRSVAAEFVRRMDMPPIAGGVRVVMTRRGPAELDSDNLAGAFKAVRDGIADAYGVDDRDKRYQWVTEQEKAGAGVYEVRIELYPAPERAAKLTMADAQEGLWK